MSPLTASILTSPYFLITFTPGVASYLYYAICVNCVEATPYFTDRDIEELGERQGEEQVTLGWLAAQFQAFVDLHSDFDVPVDPLATWLARSGDVDDEP